MKRGYTWKYRWLVFVNEFDNGPGGRCIKRCDKARDARRYVDYYGANGQYGCVRFARRKVPVSKFR